MTRAAMGAVVTGGGSGIGRALARRLAAGGARVVVNDVDPGAAKAVADEVGGLAAPADVATRDGVAGLVAAARDYLGEIDLYCSNAGIAVAGDVNGEGRPRPKQTGSAPGTSTSWPTCARPSSCCLVGWPGAMAGWSSPPQPRAC